MSLIKKINQLLPKIDQYFLSASKTINLADMESLDFEIHIRESYNQPTKLELFSDEKFKQSIKFDNTTGIINDRIKIGKYSYLVIGMSKSYQDKQINKLKDFIITIHKITSNTAEIKGYLIPVYHYFSYATAVNPLHSTGPLGVDLPEYNMKHYREIGKILNYTLYKKKHSRKCLWVADGEQFYPATSVQTAVEWFALSIANDGIKETIPQLKERLNIKLPFNQDFTRIEYEAKAIAEVKKVLDGKDEDLNDILFNTIVTAFEKMDDFTHERVIKAMKDI